MADRADAQCLYDQAAEGGAPAAGMEPARAHESAADAAASLWAEGLRQQVYLGDADFVTRVQALAEGRWARFDRPQVPRAQRASPLTLDD